MALEDIEIEIVGSKPEWVKETRARSGSKYDSPVVSAWMDTAIAGMNDERWVEARVEQDDVDFLKKAVTRSASLNGVSALVRVSPVSDAGTVQFAFRAVERIRRPRAKK